MNNSDTTNSPVLAWEDAAEIVLNATAMANKRWGDGALKADIDKAAGFSVQTPKCKVHIAFEESKIVVSMLKGNNTLYRTVWQGGEPMADRAASLEKGLLYCHHSVYAFTL